MTHRHFSSGPSTLEPTASSTASTARDGRKPSRFFSRRPRVAASPRRGMAVVWLALMTTVFMGVAAMSIDGGFHLTRKASAQKSADAAALAGAQRLATVQGVTAATDAAYEYALRNGYNRAITTGDRETKVVVTYPMTGNDPVTGQPYPSNWFMVQLARREPRFFGAAFLALISSASERGSISNTQWVGATSVAEFISFVEMAITDKGKYGTNGGNATLSMFGPDARFANGDFKSPKFKDDAGTVANEDYRPDVANDKDEESGYNFAINLASNTGNAKVEIFDPDTYNAPGGSGSQGDAQTGLRVDEWRGVRSGNTGVASNANTTRFRLYSDNGTPANLSDDFLIAERNYASDPATDMKWVKAFEFDRGNYPNIGGKPQNFRLNVQSMTGSSENGFNIRAGKRNDETEYKVGNTKYDDTEGYPPADAVVTKNDFLTNGSSVTAKGFLPINFNKSGNLEITLGSVPVEAKGRKLEIRKFDTDVNNNAAVTYVCDQVDGTTLTYSGVLAGNGEFKTDFLQLPADYKGGVWRAVYNANIQDTSVWEMKYNGGSKNASSIKLVR